MTSNRGLIYSLAVAILLALGTSPVFGASAAFLDYPGATPGLDAVVVHQTPGFGLTVDSLDDGDWRPSFGGIAFDPANGVIIPTAYPTFGQDDIGASGMPGRAFIEVAGRFTEFDPLPGFANGWLALTDISGGGTEANFDLGFVYFPFSEGWIAGSVSSTGTFVAGNISGVTVAADPDDTGRWTFSIAGVDSVTSGMLFTVGGDNANSGNTVSTDVRSDGSGWDIISYDQGGNFVSDDGDAEGDGGQTGTFHFAYVPYTTRNLIGGRIDDNGSTFNGTGNFTVQRSSAGVYFVQIPDGAGGFFDASDGLIIATVSKGATLNTALDPDDNFLEISYDGVAQGWTVRSFDLSGANAQDTEFVFAFNQYAQALVPEPTVSLLLLAGAGVLLDRRRRNAKGSES